MFSKKELLVKASKEKEFVFDMFAKTQNLEDDTTSLEVGQPRKVYNFISSDGTLKAGYGFKTLSMPKSIDTLDTEYPVVFADGEIKAMWKLKNYDYDNGVNKYYILYFNNDGTIYFDNLFGPREILWIIPTQFTSAPYGINYRVAGNDTLLLSGEGGKMMVVTGSDVDECDNTPPIKSCCAHYGKLFAITSLEPGLLMICDDANPHNWSIERTKDLDFGDNKGDLNKILSFNDYLYIFRDFGITKMSEYGKDENYEICHIYQSDAYIYPNTIAESGDKIYFLEGSKIKYFNGSSIKSIDLDCLKILEGCDNRNAYGECFDGKYYLACRADFKDGASVGCEAGQFKNNLLLVYDTLSGHVDFMRGVDINMLLALTNRFKSKLVACFYDDNHKGSIAELTKDGKFYDTNLKSLWESGQTDFGYSGTIKRIKHFNIKSEQDCIVTFSSERQTKSFVVKGKNSVQKIRANVLGNLFTVKIESQNSGCYISNFVLTVSCG